MTPANGAGGPMGPSMQAPSGAAMGRNPSGAGAQNGSLGGEIGNNQGNSVGNGLSQGNRTEAMGGAGSQTVSRFDRGSGETESEGRNQMLGQGPGQAHGSAGSSGGGSGGGANRDPTQGGRAWGSGPGDRLSLGTPGVSGPLGHDVDPGGMVRQPPQLAPGAQGVMMPGVAQQGAPTGPTSEAPVAPGSLLPNAPGDGALAGALDEDPESAMTTQRVPPSLRAYVRRYFQRMQGGSAPRSPNRSP